MSEFKKTYIRKNSKSFYTSMADDSDSLLKYIFLFKKKKYSLLNLQYFNSQVPIYTTLALNSYNNTNYIHIS